MRRYRRCVIILGAALLIFALTATQAPAKTWKITAAAGHPPVFLFISTIQDTFIPYVNEHLAPLGHKVEWKTAFGGTVCKIGGCLEALESGIVEMANVGTIFEAAEMPLHNVTYFTPFTTKDPEIVMDAMMEVGEKIPEVKNEWTKHNAVHLGSSAVDTYSIFAKFPIHSVDDVNGRKIGTAGPCANWLKGTGAVPVATNLPEAYNSLQLGVFDGYVVFDTGAMGIKIFEVAPYVARLNFGAQFAGGVAINKRFFDSLPSEVQKVFIDAGKAYDKKYVALQNAKANGAGAAMKKAGATFIEFSDAERAKWANRMPNVPMEWAASMEQKGLPGKAVVKAYMDGLRKRGVKLVRDWDRE